MRRRDVALAHHLPILLDNVEKHLAALQARRGRGKRRQNSFCLCLSATLSTSPMATINVMSELPP